MSRRLLRRAKDVLHLLVRGHPSIVLRAAIGTRLRSNSVAFGLRFVPYLKRTESWRLLRRQICFTPLPEGMPYPFD